MRLYQRKAFVWNSPGTLTDGAGQVRYRLLGDAYAPVRRLRLKDLAGRDVLYARQSLPDLFPRFSLESYGKPMGSLELRRAENQRRFIPEDPRWTIAGTPDALDYSVNSLLTLGLDGKCTRCGKEQAWTIDPSSHDNVVRTGCLWVLAFNRSPAGENYLWPKARSGTPYLVPRRKKQKKSRETVDFFASHTV